MRSSLGPSQEIAWPGRRFTTERDAPAGQSPNASSRPRGPIPGESARSSYASPRPWSRVTGPSGPRHRPRDGGKGLIEQIAKFYRPIINCDRSEWPLELRRVTRGALDLCGPEKNSCHRRLWGDGGSGAVRCGSSAPSGFDPILPGGFFDIPSTASKLERLRSLTVRQGEAT
jgi:hypothetical protein